MITVYSRKDEGNIDYAYDEAGNRTRKTVNGDVTDYKYYADTNKLKTDGEYAYVYDEAGNLVKKGNSYNIEGDNVTFTEKEGRKVEYYEYTYNLQGRLEEVTRNGEKVAEFIYDTDGMRIKSEEKLSEEEGFQTTDYVYSQRGDVLLEDTGSSDGKTSYVYAFEKTFARVDGTVTPGEEMDTTYFHHDTTDSTRLMTDSAGEVTMDQDYLPFGGDLPGAGKDAVVNKDGESYKYTGQKEVVSIGLYYYKARWYDPSIGRFNREDDYQGELKNPQSLNLYVYVMNNPLKYSDPTGNKWEKSTTVIISFKGGGRKVYTSKNKSSKEYRGVLNAYKNAKRQGLNVATIESEIYYPNKIQRLASKLSFGIYNTPNGIRNSKIVEEKTHGYSSNVIRNINRDLVNVGENEISMEVAGFILGQAGLDDIGISKKIVNNLIDDAAANNTITALNIVGLGRSLKSAHDSINELNEIRENNSHISHTGLNYLDTIFMMEPSEAESYFDHFNVHATLGNDHAKEIKDYELEEAAIIMNDAVDMKKIGFDPVEGKEVVDSAKEAAEKLGSLSLDIVRIILSAGNL